MMPPQAPAVTAQQAAGSGMSPMGQFAQNMTSGQGDQKAIQEFSSSQFLNEKLDAIAQNLSSVAKVLIVSRPDLMPLVQKMAQMGSVLNGQITSGQSTGAAGATPEPDADDAGATTPQEGSAAMTLGS